MFLGSRQHFVLPNSFSEVHTTGRRKRELVQMIRRSLWMLIGVESDIRFSVIKDKKYLEHRLALLGKEDANLKPQPLTDEQLRRFTSSVGSAESLFNKEAGMIPTNTVDETGQVIGSTQLDPTRYGDWEVNGRCYDF